MDPLERSVTKSRENMNTIHPNPHASIYVNHPIPSDVLLDRNHEVLVYQILDPRGHHSSWSLETADYQVIIQPTCPNIPNHLSPSILAHWWIWRQKVRKCDSQQLMTKRTYFGVKIIFGEMSTDWELNPSSRSPPSSHLLSPNDFEALSPSFFLL